MRRLYVHGYHDEFFLVFNVVAMVNIRGYHGNVCVKISLC